MDELKVSCWKCAACNTVFEGNAVKPAKSVVSMDSLMVFCARCEVGLRVVTGTGERIPLEDWLGIKGETDEAQGE